MLVKTLLVNFHKIFIKTILLVVFSTNLLQANTPKSAGHKKKILISGLGVYINNFDVLTSYSAIMNCKDVGIFNGNNKLINARLLNAVKISKGNLAFLRTNKRSQDYITLGNYTTKKDDAVNIIGLNDKVQKENFSGQIAFIGDDKHDIEFISNEARKGNSGSPLYNEKGYMIGILKGISNSNVEGRYVTGTSIQTIRQFAIKNGVRLSPPKFHGKNQTNTPNFFDNFGVNIACYKKDQSGNLAPIGSFGTGVFVNPNDVITNAHVVNNCNEIRVMNEKETFKAKLIAKLPEKQGDIAFLRTKAKRQNYAFYDDRLPRAGQKIFFPFFTQNRGIFKKSIAEVSYVGNKNHGMEIIAPQLQRITPGAPVLDLKGRLLGILSTRLNYNGNQSMLIATPASNISRLANVSRVRIKSARLARHNANEINKRAIVRIVCAN